MIKDLNKILSYTVKENDCLIWTRCFNTDGYPRAVIDDNNNGKVHRLVYELSSGEDIKGRVVRHTCDNPKCINPAHLLIGTPADNVKDMDDRERRGNAKLSRADVRAIRILRKSGEYSAKQLASMYNMDLRTIHSLLSYTHWRNVT